MLGLIAEGILEDPTASFILGLVVVAVFGFITRNYLAKRKD